MFDLLIPITAVLFVLYKTIMVLNAKMEQGKYASGLGKKVPTNFPILKLIFNLFIIGFFISLAVNYDSGFLWITLVAGAKFIYDDTLTKSIYSNGISLIDRFIKWEEVEKIVLLKDSTILEIYTINKTFF